MSWIVLALCCSVLNAVSSALTKHAAHDTGARAATFWSYALGLPFVLIALAATPDGVVTPRSGFWPALALGVAGNLAAISLRNYGIKISPLSLTIPLLSLTPVFLLLTELILLGDAPTVLGGAGVALIVAGTTIAHWQRGAPAWGAALALWRERGCRWMIVVALLWSLTSILDKVCVTRSSAATYLVAFHLGFVAGYLPILAAGNVDWRGALRRHGRLFVLIGLVHTASLFTQMWAIERTLVSYVIAIKRAGMPLSVVFGVLFFGERQMAQRLAGAVAMAAGVALILTGS